MSLYIPGQFRDEVRRTLAAYKQLNVYLRHADVDAADEFMAKVMQTEGVRVYEAVLAMVAAASGIPPKDIPR